MARTRLCCSTLSLRRTGDDLHVSCHKGFKIRLAGIVPVPLEFTHHLHALVFYSGSRKTISLVMEGTLSQQRVK